MIGPRWPLFGYQTTLNDANYCTPVSSISAAQKQNDVPTSGPGHGGTAAAGRAAADGMARPLRAATVTGDAGPALPPIPR